MKERPILFSGEMVRAILEGRKTQTRRVVKGHALSAGNIETAAKRNPYGQPGDRLWVKEPFRIDAYWGRNVRGIYTRTGDTFQKTLSHDEHDKAMRWKKPTGGKSSLFMFKSLARITLEITGIRVERLQDISNEDALSEGITIHEDQAGAPPFFIFRLLWDGINAKRGFSWSSNPWVWVVEFRMIDGKAVK